MAGYFASRIEKGKLNYNDVVKKYPEWKEDIDFILATDGYVINEKGVAVKKENE